MTRQNAEKIITEYVKPIFGFALKRCRTLEDAEDLSQEIVLRAFQALLKRDDINDVSKFIWTVAHNALSNYYRDSAKCITGVPLDDLTDILASPDPSEDSDNNDAVKRLQHELAYLSKIQRKIVIAYYFDGRKQSDIAKSLNIPLGTVKWHLFEAKKELKRGIDTMRKANELKFNPIKFESIGLNGSSGKKELDEFFRSPLSQNICYSVRNTAKTVNEIADDLGVSPVYVEAEAEYLEEYGFLQVQNGRYRVNFIISEPTAELLEIQNSMYSRAAELFANDLYDELTASGILDNSDIICGQTDEPLTLTSAPKRDYNFLLWTLIPFIAAWSGKDLRDNRISFDEVATVRPDGGHNIVHASVVPENIRLSKDYVHMKNWCGPMWNGLNGYIMWQVNHEWCSRSIPSADYTDETLNVLMHYLTEEENGLLSKLDYTMLSELGYVKTCGEYNGLFKSSWQIVILEDEDIKSRLLAIGDRIKAKYKAEFDAIKEPYVKAVLDTVPAHLRKIKEHELQYVFHSDGWFLCHCVVCLLKNGKLTKPTEGQRKAVSTLIFRDKV